MQKIKEIAKEVLNAILPITIIVAILQLVILKLPWSTFFQFFGGIVLVGIGLILFLLGTQLGLLPMGEYLGGALPKTGKAWLVIFFGFLLGFLVTVAEPNVRILARQVESVSPVLGQSTLILTIALGVAIFMALAMLRFLLGFPVSYLLVISFGLMIALAPFAPKSFFSIAFDAGGVTTGPLLVPFNLALGMGVASALGGKGREGFGLVAMAYVAPVLAVLLLGVILG
jgi:hypothetical protein